MAPAKAKTNEPITMDALPAGSVVELQGKQYPTHAGLLALAHAHGMTSMTTDVLSYQDGEAVVKATVEGSRGTYTGHGDASPANVNRNIASAVLRMAETRSQNRAIRAYLGLGATTLEEMPPEALQGGGNRRPAPKAQNKPQRQADANTGATAAYFQKGDTVRTSNGNVGLVFWVGTGDKADRVGVRYGDGDEDKEWTYQRFLSEAQPADDGGDDELPF